MIKSFFEHDFNDKNESIVEESYNKTVMDFNFGRHEVFAAMGNITFSGR